MTDWAEIPGSKNSAKFWEISENRFFSKTYISRIPFYVQIFGCGFFRNISTVLLVGASTFWYMVYVQNKICIVCVCVYFFENCVKVLCSGYHYYIFIQLLHIPKIFWYNLLRIWIVYMFIGICIDIPISYSYIYFCTIRFFEVFFWEQMCSFSIWNEWIGGKCIHLFFSCSSVFSTAVIMDEYTLMQKCPYLFTYVRLFA